jgi:hypothetical protein
MYLYVKVYRTVHIKYQNLNYINWLYLADCNLKTYRIWDHISYSMRYTHDPRIGKCIEFLEFYSSIVIEKV